MRGYMWPLFSSVFLVAYRTRIKYCKMPLIASTLNTALSQKSISV